MNAVVFEHVPLTDLPEAWRARLHLQSTAQVRVRIEEETTVGTPEANPLFGMWKDREDMRDATAYIASQRQSRFDADGARRTP